MGNQATERFQTGNHVLLFTRGEGERKLLGTGQVGRNPESTSVDIGANTGARPIHTVGDAEPQDIVDGAHTYDVTLAMIRLRDRGAADVINAGPIDIDEIDKYTGARIQTAEECHCVSGRISVQANNPVARNIQFSAMRVK